MTAMQTTTLLEHEPQVEVSEHSKLRHDLRTFLNHIIGYCDLVQQDAAEENATDAVASLAEVGSEAGAIVEQLNELKAETPDYLERAGAVRSKMQRFGADVATACQTATEAARRSGAECLIPDLVKIQNAAIGLANLAAELGDPLVGDAPAVVVKAPVVIEPVAESRTAPQPASSPVSNPQPGKGRVLVVDDNPENRDLLRRFLERDGLNVVCASGGREGLKKLSTGQYDLILLDLLMPDLDGFSVLRSIKADAETEHTPVVVLSAVDELQKVLSCIEMGAEDYLTKPFNPILMRSRVQVLLARKRLQDEERRRTAALQSALEAVEAQKKISEELLSNILPGSVAAELREKGFADPMYFEDATIVLTDFVGFTSSTEKLSAEELVDVLNQYFTAFDRIMGKYGLEKLKTIGDSYMFVSGLPHRSGSHPVDAVLAALEMVRAVEAMAGDPVDWKMRVGIHTGPVIAGVVGIRKFAFDVWGESVNLASRMESSGSPNRVNISERTYVRVKDFFSCEHRGKVKTKEGREVDMYFVNGIVPKLLEDVSVLPPRNFCRRYKVYFQKTPAAFPEHLARPAAEAASSPK